jgi:hypothetical protein
MATSTQTAAPLAPGFFEGKNPSRIILGAFPAITLPLVASVMLPVDQRFQLIYIWLFGLTHFVLTLSFYLQRENLRHFTATARNIFLFIVVPVTILMGFYVIGRSFSQGGTNPPWLSAGRRSISII